MERLLKSKPEIIGKITICLLNILYYIILLQFYYVVILIYYIIFAVCNIFNLLFVFVFLWLFPITFNFCLRFFFKKIEIETKHQKNIENFGKSFLKISFLKRLKLIKEIKLVDLKINKLVAEQIIENKNSFITEISLNDKGPLIVEVQQKATLNEPCVTISNSKTQSNLIESNKKISI